MPDDAGGRQLFFLASESSTACRHLHALLAEGLGLPPRLTPRPSQAARPSGHDVNLCFGVHPSIHVLSIGYWRDAVSWRAACFVGSRGRTFVRPLYDGGFLTKMARSCLWDFLSQCCGRWLSVGKHWEALLLAGVPVHGLYFRRHGKRNKRLCAFVVCLLFFFALNFTRLYVQVALCDDVRLNHGSGTGNIAAKLACRV